MEWFGKGFAGVMGFFVANVVVMCFVIFVLLGCCMACAITGVLLGEPPPLPIR